MATYSTGKKTDRQDKIDNRGLRSSGIGKGDLQATNVYKNNLGMENWPVRFSDKGVRKTITPHTPKRKPVEVTVTPKPVVKKPVAAKPAVKKPLTITVTPGKSGKTVTRSAGNGGGRDSGNRAGNGGRTSGGFSTGRNTDNFGNDRGAGGMARNTNRGK